MTQTELEHIILLLESIQTLIKSIESNLTKMEKEQ